MESRTAVWTSARHAGPPLGLVAAIFVILFLAGWYPVTMYGKGPHFPWPGDLAETVAAYFRAHPTAVLLTAFLHFGAAIPLGIFTATVVNRLQFLGVEAAGPSIALFGGFAAAFNMLMASSVLWTATHRGIADDVLLAHGLYRMHTALAGPGLAVPLGLLVAGLAIPAGVEALLPRWFVVAGLAVAVCGELSWLSLISAKALFLVPLAASSGFAWLIAAGFALPDTVEYVRPAAERVVRAKVA